MTIKEKYEKAYQEVKKGKSLKDAIQAAGFQPSGSYYKWLKKAHPEFQPRNTGPKKKVVQAEIKKPRKYKARPYVQEIPIQTQHETVGKIICIIGTDEQIKNVLKGII